MSERHDLPLLIPPPNILHLPPIEKHRAKLRDVESDVRQIVLTMAMALHTDMGHHERFEGAFRKLWSVPEELLPWWSVFTPKFLSWANLCEAMGWRGGTDLANNGVKLWKGVPLLISNPGSTSLRFSSLESYEYWRVCLFISLFVFKYFYVFLISLHIFIYLHFLYLTLSTFI